jgi:hypothetical protein
MIEDIQGAINPIIQAMIATANLQKQGQQQDIEKERNKQEADARKEQLKQATVAMGYQHEHNLAQIAVQQKLAEAEVESRHASSMLAHQQFVHAGGDYRSVLGKNALEQIAPGLNDAIQGGTVPQMMVTQPQQPQQEEPQGMSDAAGFQQNQPTAQTPPTQPLANPYGSADEVAAIQAKAAGLKAKAEAEGKLPSEQTLAGTAFQNQTALQKSRLDSEEKVAGLQRGTQMSIAKMSQGTQMSIAQMEAKTRLQVAGMGGDEGSQNLVHSLALGGATGEIKLNPANPLERLAYSQLQQAGGQDVDNKQVLAAKESQKMLPLLTKLEDYAKNLPDTVGGAFVQGHVTGAKNALGISSDLQNKINIINSQAMVVGKAVEGLSGRPLSTQLKLDLDTLSSPGITKSMMLDRINNLRENYVNNQQNVIFSGMPSWQKELITKKYGIQPVATQSPQTQPDWLKIAPQKTPAGKVLDPTTSLSEGHPVYK